MAYPLAPQTDTRLTQIRQKLAEKEAEAKSAWKEVEAKKTAIEKGELSGEKALSAAKAAKAAYEQVADECDQVREELNAHLDQIEGKGGGSFSHKAGAPLSSITKAFIDGVGGGSLSGLKAFTTGAAVVPAFFDDVIRTLPQRQLLVRALLPTAPADSDTVQFLRQTVATHAASPVAAGAEKPRSVYTVERAEAAVRVIATVSEAIDRSILSDHDALRKFLDQQLRMSVLLAEEQQIISGSGVAPNLRGILNTVGINTVARNVAGNETRIDALARAVTACRLAFHEPDAIVLHPNDWQDILMEKDTTNRHLASSVTEANPNALWGKPVVTSPVIAEGTGLVGAFLEGAQVWQREDARVSFTEAGLGDAAGQELFTRNLLRFRGEERIAFAVTSPAAFTSVTAL